MGYKHYSPSSHMITLTLNIVLLLSITGCHVVYTIHQNQKTGTSAYYSVFEHGIMITEVVSSYEDVSVEIDVMADTVATFYADSLQVFVDERYPIQIHAVRREGRYEGETVFDLAGHVDRLSVVFQYFITDTSRYIKPGDTVTIYGPNILRVEDRGYTLDTLNYIKPKAGSSG